MNTLYALIVACLSLHAACFGRPETPAVATDAAWSIIDEDDTTATATRPLLGYSFDAGADFNFGAEHTAAVKYYLIDDFDLYSADDAAGPDLLIRASD
jgi:hypothetical protein